MIGVAYYEQLLLLVDNIEVYKRVDLFYRLRIECWNIQVEIDMGRVCLRPCS